MQTDKRIIEAAENHSHKLGFKNHIASAYKLGFEQGIESPINQILKLEFAIEQLKAMGQVHDEGILSERLRDRIKELEPQLEELKKQL